MRGRGDGPLWDGRRERPPQAACGSCGQRKTRETAAAILLAQGSCARTRHSLHACVFVAPGRGESRTACGAGALASRVHPQESEGDHDDFSTSSVPPVPVPPSRSSRAPAVLPAKSRVRFEARTHSCSAYIRSFVLFPVRLLLRASLLPVFHRHFRASFPLCISDFLKNSRGQSVQLLVVMSQPIATLQVMEELRSLLILRSEQELVVSDGAEVGMSRQVRRWRWRMSDISLAL